MRDRLLRAVAMRRWVGLGLRRWLCALGGGSSYGVGRPLACFWTLFGTLFMGAMVGLVSPAHAAAGNAATSPAAEPSKIAYKLPLTPSDAAPSAAADWLTRIHDVAQTQNYAGTFVYQRGGTVQSSRVVHYLAGGIEYERMESLDGSPRTLLQRGDQLYTLLPDQKALILDERNSKNAFPALPGAGGSQVLEVYAARLGGTDRVADHDCQIIELNPRDSYRFAYKLWAEQKTGLLLRAQTLDAQGNVLEQIAFSQITLGGAAPAGRDTVEAALRAMADWRVIRSPVAEADLAAQGWQINSPIPGFKLIHQLRRPMASRTAGAPPIAVDQAVFSDGLTAISIFIEPRSGSDRKEGVASSGATHILVERQGDFWVTLLGEVPLATLQRFASALEYKAPK